MLAVRERTGGGQQVVAAIVDRAGWQHVHVAVDDHSRLACAEVRSSADRVASVTLLRQALA